MTSIAALLWLKILTRLDTGVLTRYIRSADGGIGNPYILERLLARGQRGGQTVLQGPYTATPVGQGQSLRDPSATQYHFESSSESSEV